MLRIALVVDHFLPRVGGIELHVADLARQLAAAERDVEVITTTPGPDALDGVRVRRLSGPLLPHFQILCHARPVRELRALLTAGRYDVVHCHTSIVSPLAYAAAWESRRERLPCVMTTHSLLGPHTLAFGAINRLLEIYRWPTCLSTVSSEAARRLARMARRDDVAVLANGIDAARWAIEPIADAPLRVTSVMRLNIKKRPQDLVAAVPHVLERLPDRLRPTFTLIGDGPYRRRLERQARRLGVADAVEFLGFRSRDEIKEVFRRTHVFVLPTVLEAFGIAALEARAAGLPIVAMRGGGVSDVVDHGRSGLLAGNAGEMAEHLVRLLADSELRARMAAASGAGLERFRWPRVVDDHLAMYETARARLSGASARRVPA